MSGLRRVDVAATSSALRGLVHRRTTSLRQGSIFLLAGLSLVAGLWGGLSLAASQAGQAAGASEPNLAVAEGKLVLPRPASFELLSRDSAWTTLTFRGRLRSGSDGQSAGGDIEPAGAGLLAALVVEPAPGRLTLPGVRARFVERLKAELSEEARVGGLTVVSAPGEVADDAVLVKVADVVRLQGRERLRVRAVRLLGNRLVMLHVVAEHAEAETRQAMARRAQRELLEALRLAATAGDRVGRGGREREETGEAVVRAAGLRFVVPTAYRAELTGAAEGVLAVLTTQRWPGARVVVTAVPLAGELRGDVPREVLLTVADRAVELETPVLRLPGPPGTWEEAVDSRFLRRLRREAGEEPAVMASDTRQIRVGRWVVSVAMVCHLDDEDEVAGAADLVAESVVVWRGP